jgi:hypothetical protein
MNFIEINDQLYLFLNQLISQIYPRLIKSDQDYLLTSMTRLLNVIAISFNWDYANNPDIYYDQLKQNSSRDMQSLLNLILPYIISDDAKQYLTKLEDLSTAKKDGKYFYTNVQYSRCIRYQKGQEIATVERPYIRAYLEQNLDLLIQSILMCSNKLYVNWIDVLPMTMNEYPQSTLYNATTKKVLTQTPLTSIFQDLTPGLPISTIYNCISNHLFHEIKNIKWLIYDVPTNNGPIPEYLVLRQMINLSTIDSGTHWNNLTNSIKSEFSTAFYSLIDSSESSAITINVYYFFQKYYSRSEYLIKTGVLKPVIEIVSQDDNDEDNDSTNYDLTSRLPQVRQVLKSVPIEDIYLFLLEQITSFKKTWYWYRISINNYYLASDSGRYLTLKNIFNYSKSIVYFKEQDLLINMPRHFNSLYKYLANLFYGRLVDFTNVGATDEPIEAHLNSNSLLKSLGSNGIERSWFNLNRYINRIYFAPNGATSNASQRAQYNNWIHDTARANITLVVFESLIFHGLLSKFVPNKKISDDLIVVQAGNTDDLKLKYRRSQLKLSLSDAKYKDSYYYLTGRTYADISLTQSPSKGNKTYFDFLSNDQGWTFTYAMNWVSQINFFHHYYHNRVIFVTGATGVGKSTQTPKLFLYSQKMLDFNPTGKILMTEPRIAPTRDNARQISLEMGVPIIEYDSTYKQDIPSNNFNIQYQYRGGQHVNRTTQSYLRLVTDGLLLEQMVSSPFLTKQTKNRSQTLYSADNIADIVIVDEAHEHNLPMDMILTLIRTSLYLNNSLKLVIVSATMDDDEPIYRRFYREINDNRSYPLNNFIERQQLDRVNVDRRIHISAPGQSTQFKITSHYLTEQEYSKINENNYVEYSVAKTLEVANSTRSGDILLFLTGQAEIKKTVDQINKLTPPDVICFPFYSELKDEQKNFILRIDKELPNYRRYKEDIFKSDSEITRHVPYNTYRRAIIVATNIAEASITLSSLIYVIDPGYAKVSVYDPLRGPRIIVQPISQSSATQRRGRVGRVAAGEVYHLYEPTTLANNRTSYKIL